MTPAVQVLCSPLRKKKEWDALSLCWMWCCIVSTAFLEKIYGNRKVAGKQPLCMYLFYQGMLGTNITIKVLCGVMADASLGDPYARYAAVARLMMDTFSTKCLDASYSTYLKDMTNISWEGPAAGGGACLCVLGSGGSVCMCAHVNGRERERLRLFERFLF